MRRTIAATLAASVLTATAQPAVEPTRPSVPAAAPASTVPAPAPAPALAELVERAWALARRGSVEQARAAELDARGLAVRSALAGPPSVGIDVRRDLPRWVALPGTDAAAERGRNEIEPGVSAPIWLPGQRDAQRRVLERERARLTSSTRAARLALAGDVREAAWAVALARIEHRVQQARELQAGALEADVSRRVDAGELAPVDRLTARAERLAAAAAARMAEAAVRDATARLRVLAGVDEAGELREAQAPDASILDAHPALLAAAEAADAARARLDAAGVARRDNPTVSAAARFDRDTYGGDYRNSLRIGIAVPLDTEARNAPRIAAAGAELIEAEVALQRERRERASDVERARIALEAALAVLAAGAERAAVSADARAAIERAFRAGERGLPDVLRARATALDAELAHALARERHGLAIARLNQALGIEP